MIYNSNSNILLYIYPVIVIVKVIVKKSAKKSSNSNYSNILHWNVIDPSPGSG